MNISHLTIRARLWLGFGSILFLLFAIAVMGIVQLKQANDATKHIVQINMTKMELLGDMSEAVHIVSRVMRSVALLSDPARREAERSKIAEARKKYDSAYQALRVMPLDEAGKTFVQHLGRVQDQVRPMNNRFMDLASQSDPAAVAYLLDVANPANQKWQDTIGSFMSLQKEKSHVYADQVQRSYEDTRSFMLGLALLTLVGGGMFAVWIVRSIARPLNRAVDVARQVAAGDLSATVKVHAQDRTETGSLLRAMNDMNSRLNALLSQVREGAHTLTMNSTEIAQGNMDLSARTEQQATALEQTAASMEELTGTVKNNADNAKAASCLAANTAQVAVHGGEVVNEVVSVMSRIESSSARIVEIIDVIDGIAFQTNILALNAAVEAARAGEQGRGFAVVASEVRTLAQRSATAANEIKHLINASVDQIKAGGVLVRDAGVTMSDVVSGIDKVSGLVAEIASATEQQSIGIEETHRAISDLDQINQQNTALVEEVAASAVTLKEEAAVLEDMVSQFKLMPTAFVQQSVAKPHATLALSRAAGIC